MGKPERISPFRFNPFELITGESLSGHISMLQPKPLCRYNFPDGSVDAVFDRRNTLSEVIKIRAGISTKTKISFMIILGKIQVNAFQFLAEVLEMPKDVIASKNFGRELQEKYEFH